MALRINDDKRKWTKSDRRWNGMARAIRWFVRKIPIIQIRFERNAGWWMRVQDKLMCVCVWVSLCEWEKKYRNKQVRSVHVHAMDKVCAHRQTKQSWYQCRRQHSPRHTNDLIYYIWVSINYDYLSRWWWRYHIFDKVHFFSHFSSLRSFLLHVFFSVNHFDVTADDGCWFHFRILFTPLVIVTHTHTHKHIQLACISYFMIIIISIPSANGSRSTHKRSHTDTQDCSALLMIMINWWIIFLVVFLMHITSTLLPLFILLFSIWIVFRTRAHPIHTHTHNLHLF